MSSLGPSPNKGYSCTAVCPEISLSERLLCLFPLQKILLEGGGEMREGRI